MKKQTAYALIVMGTLILASCATRKYTPEELEQANRNKGRQIQVDAALDSSTARMCANSGAETINCAKYNLGQSLVKSAHDYCVRYKLGPIEYANLGGVYGLNNARASAIATCLGKP
jgi:PBP1b-binding outer membrane lipoprotein LpoB